MRREQRLRTESQFNAVRRRGRGCSNKLLVLRTLANGLPYSRFGYLVSKRTGKAVVRNRVRRRLREIVRLTPISPGWDLVFIARGDIADQPYSQIARSVHELLRRARLLAEGHQNDVLQTGGS
ncbi:MAG: ribonuclease P protein component [Chloroflexi bacterium]|nr:ribonuclease P protein component [Chloroflexota bacterium]